MCTAILEHGSAAQIIKNLREEAIERHLPGLVFLRRPQAAHRLVAQGFSLLQHELHPFDGLPLTAKPHKRFALQVEQVLL